MLPTQRGKEHWDKQHSYPPLQRTQERGTHGSETGKKIGQKAWATRPHNRCVRTCNYGRGNPTYGVEKLFTFAVAITSPLLLIPARALAVE